MELAPYAACDETSQGRRYSEVPSSKYRTDYQRDRDRIIHATAFRRLQYKTQVFVSHEGDWFRTRLTHSLEVAQISRTVARSLKLNEDLTEAIALAHDLGHTPFGHAGQDALHAVMQPFGGFEHNLQSLRIVDDLEEKYPNFRGLNLTFETREGILKHCSLKAAKQLGAVAARFLRTPTTQPSLEAQVANLCDEIAYNNHDIEDGVRAGLITVEELREFSLFEEQYSQVEKEYPTLPQKRMVTETVRRMIGTQVTNVVQTSYEHIEALQLKDIHAVRLMDESLINFSALMYQKHMELKQFLNRNLYRHYRVQRMAYKANHIVRRLFEVFTNEIRLLPNEVQDEVRQMQDRLGGDIGCARAVADYIAGMTDRYAIHEYERLFNPTTISTTLTNY